MDTKEKVYIGLSAALIVFQPDIVIHLAAISNDPMGEAYKAVTDEINLEASKRLVLIAKKSGVKKFIFE